MEVVDEDDPRTGYLEQTLHVSRRHVARIAARPRPARPARGAPPPPSRRRRHPGRSRRRRPPSSRAWSGGASSVNRRRRAIAPESVPCSSAIAWARARPNRYGSRAPYETLSTQVQAKPAAGAAAASSAISRDLPIPASPSTTIAAPRLGVDGVEQRAQPRPLLLAPDELADRRTPRLEARLADESGHPDRLASGRAAAGARDPRPRTPCGPPGASPRRGGSRRAGRWSGSARPSSPPGPSATSRRSSVPRGAATTSPVAMPIRTWSGSLPVDSATRDSASRIARAQCAARRASSSWPFGQPKTANTASPMNFSRVPPKASIASTIAMRAVVDLAPDVLRDRARRRAGRSRRGPRRAP